MEFFEFLTETSVGPVLAAVWGALWGSFLNVVIHRLPRGESVLRPASHCTTCATPIRPWDNIPIVSWLILRGRCRACGARFSWRYAMVEVLGLGFGLACWYHAVVLGAGTPAIRVAGFLLEFFFVAGMVAITFIDIKTMIIPNAITYPMLIVLTAGVIAVGRITWPDALVGAASGYLIVFLVWAIYYAVRRQEGIGLGDGKLLAVAGGFLGWRALPQILLLGAAQGLLVSVPLLLAGRSLMAEESYAGLTDEGHDEQGDERAPDGEGEAEAGTTTETETKDEAEAEAEAEAKSDVEAELEARLAAPLQPEESEGDAAPGMLRAAVPFGPFLALAAVETLFFGSFVTDLLFPQP